MNDQKTERRLRCAVYSLAFVLSMAVLPDALYAWGPPYWKVEDLGQYAPATARTDAWAINELGEALVHVRDGRLESAFIWSPQFGATPFTPPPDEARISTQDIDDHGNALVIHLNPQGMLVRSMVYSRVDGMRELTGFGPRYPSAMNNLGVVVGSPSFRWSPVTGLEVLTTFTEPFGDQTLDVNEAGFGAGWRYAASTQRPTAYRLAPDGTIVELGQIGQFTSSQGYAINESAQIAGRTITSIDSTDRPMLWEPLTGMRYIAGPDVHGSATAINDLSQIVGAYRGPDTNPNGGPAAFYWSESTGLINLNYHVADAYGWHLSIARDINNSGEIVGVGRYLGQDRAFRLIPWPVPEPSTLLLVTVSLCTAALYARYRS